MSCYTAIQYIRYRLSAKTRHGVHSPFVYGFIEKVLLDKANSTVAHPIDIHGHTTLLPPRYSILLGRINNYCKPPDIWVVPINEASKFVAEKLPALYFEDVVILVGIHTTPANTLIWAAILSDDYIKLSIDLYGIGLLFFRKEFKERQHFVLKY